MTEYEYRCEVMYGAAIGPKRSGDQETIDIPEAAVGISLSTFGEDVWVRYLVPVEDGGDGR